MHPLRHLLKINSFTLAIIVFTLPYVAWAESEFLAVEMEGAKEHIFLDLDNGALYIGNDCLPLLYFQKEPQSKSNQSDRQIYRILHTKSRKSLKSTRTPRLPDKIVINGNQVEIISDNFHGHSRAKGRAKVGDMRRRAVKTGC